MKPHYGKGGYNMKRVSMGDRVFYSVNNVIMLFMIVICLYPMLYVLFASLSEADKLMQFSGALWKPIGFSLEAYKAILSNEMIWIAYGNTFIHVILGTAIAMVMTILCSYILSRKNIKIKKLINIILVCSMFFSGGMIPSYLAIKSYGMLNTVWAIVLPPAISAMNVIVMRTSFQSLPASLEEAAFIDGASEAQILFRIILPLSKSVLAVIGLFYGVALWNSWFSAAIYLDKREMFPLQLYLREVLINSSTDSMMTSSAGSASSDRVAISETIKYATIMVSTLPILCAYPFLQKYFVKGVMVGAVKG